jgi:methylenetetrahydrofolate dehydrogenase (NADP+)/methenyltetrahydrofolate cyclohydrolase
LPEHLNSLRITNKIDPDKEVEGFHPQNMMGTLMPDVQKNKYLMCLPAALFELFKHSGVKIRKDQEWVFVLDDEFFSNSLTNMIVRTASITVVPDDCAVTIVNSNSKKLVEHCKYVQPEWLKPGVCIIDIYANLVKEIPSKKDPNKLVPIIRGGVNVNAVENIAGVILPIPGGLMSMVLAILLRNALISFKYSLNVV